MDTSTNAHTSTSDELMCSDLLLSLAKGGTSHELCEDRGFFFSSFFFGGGRHSTLQGSFSLFH